MKNIRRKAENAKLESEAYRAVWETVEEVQNWTDSDDGLTMAARDLLGIAYSCEKFLDAGDKSGFIDWTTYNGEIDYGNTGTEQNLIRALVTWARY